MSNDCRFVLSITVVVFSTLTATVVKATCLTCGVTKNAQTLV